MMIVREFREAWRRLLKRRGYALLSVAVLGIGLGVVLFLFSLVNTLMISPLPFPQAERLVAIGWVTDNGIGIDDFASSQYLQLRAGLRSIDDAGAYTTTGVNLDQGDGATWDGSFWIAQKQTQDKPGTSDAWRLAVKKGRDGKDGK